MFPCSIASKTHKVLQEVQQINARPERDHRRRHQLNFPSTNTHPIRQYLSHHRRHSPSSSGNRRRTRLNSRHRNKHGKWNDCRKLDTDSRGQRNCDSSGTTRSRSACCRRNQFLEELVWLLASKFETVGRTCGKTRGRACGTYTVKGRHVNAGGRFPVWS